MVGEVTTLAHEVGANPKRAIPSYPWEKKGGEGDQKFSKSTKEAGEKVKNIFHQTDIMGHDHL